jgi:AcrR family transcriptional regulator
MNPEKSTSAIDAHGKIPPKERILAVAADLFYRHGIKAVGVELIAEAAGTNKMTLYRHFASKDELVAEYLRKSAKGAHALWDELESMHPGDPLGQLRAWLEAMGKHASSADKRGCPLANAAVELPEKDHPARRVIEDCKQSQRARLLRLCEATGLKEPELLADELHILLEGALVTAQSMGAAGLGARLTRMGEALIKSHAS